MAHGIMSGLCLWITGRPGLVEPITESQLATLSPAWAEETARYFVDCQGQDWRCSSVVPQGAAVLVAGPCGSTQDVLASLVAEQDLPPWTSLLAPSQRQGRGQLRRDWHSPVGNLYASTLWPTLPPAWNRLASLLAGYSLAMALYHSGLPVRIKWPNDILLGGAKVGGILVEERQNRLIVGCGLNVVSAPPAEDLRQGHAVAAGTLAAYGAGNGPLALWLRLMPELRAEAEQWLRHATVPASFLRRLQEHMAFLGQEVVVRDGEREMAGRLLGVAADGGLRLGRPEGEQTLYSGSLLPL